MISETVIDEFDCVLQSISDGIGYFTAVNKDGKKFEGNFPRIRFIESGIRLNAPFTLYTVVTDEGRIKFMMQANPSFVLLEELDEEIVDDSSLANCSH